LYLKNSSYPVIDEKIQGALCQMKPSQEGMDRLLRIARQLHIGINDFDSFPTEDSHELIRARINGVVFSKTVEWMDPLWVVRYKSKHPKFDSTGLRNRENMNWITIGGVRSKHYGLSDTSGLVSPHLETGSIDVWIKGSDGIIFPALSVRDGLKLELHAQEDQVFYWNTAVGSVAFSRQIYHVNEVDRESLYQEISVQNRSLEETIFTFYVVLRPVSVRGIEPVEVVEFDASNLALYLNERLTLKLDQEPSAIILGSADDNAMISKLDGLSRVEDIQYTDDNGLATVVLRYDIKLGPAAKVQLFFVSPLDKIMRQDAIPQYGMSSDQRDSSISKWFTFSEPMANVTYPERRLNLAMLQARAVLSMTAQRTLIDSTLSWSERVKILHAQCLANDTESAEEHAINLVDIWKDCESSPPSQLLWGILQCYEFSQNISFLRRIRPFINHALDLLIDELSSYTSKEEGQGLGEIVEQEHEASERESSDASEEVVEASSDGNDIVSVIASEPTHERAEPVSLDELNDILWKFRALRITERSLDAVGDVKRAEAVRNFSRTILEIINEQLEVFFDRVSPTKFQKYTSNMEGLLNLLDIISILCDLSKARLIPDRTHIIVNAIADHNLTDSLLCIPGTPRLCSSHLALRLVKYYSVCGGRNEAELLIKRILEFLSDYDVLPDFVNTVTTGGTGNIGCSALAAADLIIALRYMIVYEMGADLTILGGVPDEWFTSEMSLSLNDIPTSFGPINIALGSSANQHQIELLMTKLPEEIQVNLPYHIPVSMVKVFGGGVAKRHKDDLISFICVVPLSNEVVLTYHK